MNAPGRFLLRIPLRFRKELEANARTTAPHECCGLLAGAIQDGVGTVSEHYPLSNSLASETEFLSAPAEMLAAVKEMRKKRIDVLAVYHSHPTSEPVPSNRDLERNYSEAVVNLIIGPGFSEILGWWLTGEGYKRALFEWFKDECSIHHRC